MLVDKELKKNQAEERAMKNFLLLMQDAKNAPWAEGTNLTKAEYIVYVR
jgi:hypothetical protein